MLSSKVVFPVVIAILLFSSAFAETPHGKVVVGPNILVSRDGDTPHVETMVAAHPTDANKLLGGAIVVNDGEKGANNKGYVSIDGGYRWRDIWFPEQTQESSADPQVAFGLHGTQYFLGIALIRGANNAYRSGVYFYRSEDDGKTWDKGVNLGSGDHEQIVVDTSAGKYAGRVYVGMLRGNYTIQLFRSEDDGRTFIGPVEAAAEHPLGVNVTNMLLFSNGDLFVPYSIYQIDPEKRKTINRGSFSFVISTDGGVTFSKAKHIQDQVLPKYEDTIKQYKNGDIVQGTFPQFGLDSNNGKYKDRIYAVWNDYRVGPSRLFVSYSSDRGETWSDPKQINPGAPAGSSQYQPAVAVNKNGALGIEWFDTRNSVKGDSFDVYFAASIDGGETFTAPAKVSYAESYPARGGNLNPSLVMTMASKEGGPASTRFLSAMNRWKGGGDYIGLAADANGAFHLFWPDSRTGTYHLYSALVTVEAEEDKVKNVAEKVTQNLQPADISSSIELVFDPIEYDVKSREIVVPVRLRNTSEHMLYGPISVEVKSLTDPNQTRLKMDEFQNVPTVLNSDNKKSGIGATFDYSKALGTADVLPPNGLSEAVPWRLQFENPTLTSFSVQTEVRGRVPQAPVAAGQ